MIIESIVLSTICLFASLLFFKCKKQKKVCSKFNLRTNNINFRKKRNLGLKK